MHLYHKILEKSIPIDLRITFPSELYKRLAPQSKMALKKCVIIAVEVI
jgi:dUTPase